MADKKNYDCEGTVHLKIECCGDNVLDCWIVEPDFQPTDTLSETAAKICPILGGNRASRTLSQNPFMSSQAASPIPGLRLASPSDSCTPICTDSDGDGYYVQSGCGTGGAVDCDDGNGNIKPGMPESCADGVDNNCDGKIDASDPGCTPSDPCPDPANPIPCGTRCIPADAVCCGETACAAGKECCGTGCMPAGNVCCAPLGHCSPGSTCDYEKKTCISSGAVVTDFSTQGTTWPPVLEGPNN